LFGLNLYLWAEYRILVHLTMPALGAVISYAYISGLSFLMEKRTRQQMHQLFGRYVHPGIIQHMMENPDAVEMGGDEINITVLFSDIYNFTGFSEGKGPRQLVSVLNEYFDQLAQIVLDHDGMLDKYTGDGIMALFGAPVPFDDERQHARLACRAALAHRQLCNLLQASGEELSTAAQFHINTRLGLNSGPAVAGNIGSQRRMDYTAIGDTVNLAARLEGINKVYKTHIIISQSTYALVGEEFVCRQLDLVRVVGKQEATALYELIGIANDELIGTTNDQGDHAWIATYQQALALYQKGEWQTALAQFEHLAAQCKDLASVEMAARCQKLIAAPPENWEGIWTAESK
jgi:adenylate cyclase